jgi:hypothetical protein
MAQDLLQPVITGKSELDRFIREVADRLNGLVRVGSLSRTGLHGWDLDPSSFSPLTTKGDIFTFSTVNDRLPVGTNSQIIVADSTATTGLKWVTTSGDLSNSGGAFTIANDAVTFAKMQNIATDSLVGRDTAGTGDPESITLNATLSFTGAGTIQRAALTGDVTASAGSNATTIANDAVTYAKMQNVSAASRLLGRGDSGSGDPEEIQLSADFAMTGTTLGVAANASASDMLLRHSFIGGI